MPNPPDQVPTGVRFPWPSRACGATATDRHGRSGDRWVVGGRSTDSGHSILAGAWSIVLPVVIRVATSLAYSHLDPAGGKFPDRKIPGHRCSSLASDVSKSSSPAMSIGRSASGRLLLATGSSLVAISSGSRGRAMIIAAASSSKPNAKADKRRKLLFLCWF